MELVEMVGLAVVVVGIVLSFVHHPGYLGSGQDLGGLTRWGGMVPVSVGPVLQLLPV